MLMGEMVNKISFSVNSLMVRNLLFMLWLLSN